MFLDQLSDLAATFGEPPVKPSRIKPRARVAEDFGEKWNLPGLTMTESIFKAMGSKTITTLQIAISLYGEKERKSRVYASTRTVCARHGGLEHVSCALFAMLQRGQVEKVGTATWRVKK